MVKSRRGVRGSRVGVVMVAGCVAAVLVASVASAASFSSPKTIGDAGQSRGFPRIASDSAGDSLVVWHDYQQSKGRIQALPIAADGTIGSTSTLSDPGADSNNPAVDLDATGTATVVWGGSAGVQWTHVSADGSQTPPASLGEGEDPDVAVNDAGRAVVVWSDYPALRAAIVEPDGSVGTVQTLDEHLLDFGDVANVAIDATGRATAVWQGYAGGAPAVMASRFSTDGTAGPVLRISTRSKPAFPGGVAIDAQGVTTAAWSKRSGQVMATRVTADGRLGQTKKLGDSRFSGSPEVVIDSSGTATVAWRAVVGSRSDLHWVRLSSSGAMSKERSVARASVDSMGIDGAGRVTLVWNWTRAGSRTSPPPAEIRALQLQANGKAGKVQTLSSKGENTYDFQGFVEPVVAVAESGTARVVWPNTKAKIRYAATR